MKKGTFLLFAFLLAGTICHAAGGDELLTLLNLKQDEATQDEVTSLLGKPSKVEDNKKQTLWYYNSNESNIIIYWDNKKARLEKFSYTAVPEKKNPWDNSLTRGLKSGETNLEQAIKILGTPKDLVKKLVNQEMHYTYQGNVLNLFFHNGTLVNYTLY